MCFATKHCALMAPNQLHPLESAVRISAFAPILETAPQAVLFSTDVLMAQWLPFPRTAAVMTPDFVLQSVDLDVPDLDHAGMVRKLLHPKDSVVLTINSVLIVSSKTVG